ncbi:MAG: cytochrome c-type biogenesis protein CcmH [Chloroflexi bacterium]|nr:cytochrome c-type biogenesis protein CcmH [Chloroflexota bacterium]
MGRLLPIAGTVLVLLALLAAPASAQQVGLDDAVRRIALQLQCPVCVGQTVAESNSGLAQDMRAVIRSKLEQGQSEREIMDAFVAAYGESVLSDPPKRGIGLGVWIAPVALLLFGIGVLFVLTRRWSRPTPSAFPPAAAVRTEQALVTDELQRYRDAYER